MTSTELLSTAFDFTLDKAPVELPDGTACAITGEPITSGYRAMEKGICPDALSDFNGLFNGNPHGWISESAARCLTSDWNLGSRLCLNDGETVTGYHVLTNREQAEKQGRPYWSKLVREIWPARQGQECLAILATDVKKRSWNRARAGSLGAHTPIMIFAPDWNASSVVWVDWEKLIGTLDRIEIIYTLGFSKRGIRESLTSEYTATVRVGIKQTSALEAWCADARTTPEFLPALIMAQRLAAQKSDDRSSATEPSLNIFDL